jgi:hypothetical protein
MKTFIAAAVIAAFSASPLLACDYHKDGAKGDSKAELKSERKASKSSKPSKASKPLVESKTEDKKI